MSTYINKMRMFSKAAFADEGIGPVEIAMYVALFDIDNDLAFREWFGVSDRRMKELISAGGISTITKAKNRLKQKGWIDFKADKRKTTLYKLTTPKEFLSHTVPETVSNSSTDTSTVHGTDTGTVTSTDTSTVYGTDTSTDTGTLNRVDKSRVEYSSSSSYVEPREETRARGRSREDDDLGEVLRLYEDNIKPIMGNIERDSILDLYDRYGKVWMTAAITETATNGVHSPQYVKAVLSRWEREGFKSERKKGGPNGAASENPAKTRAELEARYSDFAEADRDHVYPWDVPPEAGGARETSG